MKNKTVSLQRRCFQPPAQASVVLRSLCLFQESSWSAATPPPPRASVASERNGAISSRGRQRAFSEVRRTLKTQAQNTKSTSKRYEDIPKERKIAKHVYAVVKKENQTSKPKVLKAKSWRGRRRENGGRQIRFPGEGGGEDSQTRSGEPGAPETFRREHNRAPRPAHIEKGQRWPAPALL